MRQVLGTGLALLYLSLCVVAFVFTVTMAVKGIFFLDGILS